MFWDFHDAYETMNIRHKHYSGMWSESGPSPRPPKVSSRTARQTLRSWSQRLRSWSGMSRAHLLLLIAGCINKLWTNFYGFKLHTPNKVHEEIVSGTSDLSGTSDEVAVYTADASCKLRETWQRYEEDKEHTEIFFPCLHITNSNEKLLKMV